MFDEFLRARAERTGGPVRPIRLRRDYDDYVDGKPRRRDRSFLAPAASSCPEARRTTRRDTAVRARRPQERAVPARSASGGVQVYDGSIATWRRCGRRAAHRAVVSSSANAAQVLAPPASPTCSTSRVDGRDARREACTASRRPDTFLAAAQEARASSPRARGGLRGRPGGRGGGSRRPFRPRGRRRPGRPGGRAREHGADIVVKDLADLLFEQDALPGQDNDDQAVRVRDGALAAVEKDLTWICWPRASRSSPCRTGTSGCAATSMRATRMGYPAAT